jgi:hypothetical protein
MSVYNYVAESNPNAARKIIDSFGYEVVNTRDLGQSLNELVAQEGEPALQKVMEAHPDKDIILELFSNTTPSATNSGCGCKKCQEKSHGHYLNASGVDASDLTGSNPNSNTTTLAHQTNVILIVATLFIATALIIKKN